MKEQPQQCPHCGGTCNKSRAICRLKQTILRTDVRHRVQKVILRKKTPAANQFFAVAELLEMTLSQLDQRSLLVNQRVNRQWYTVINSSAPLQRQLWMQPPRPGATVPGQAPPVVLNPVLQAIFVPSHQLPLIEMDWFMLYNRSNWAETTRQQRAVLRRNASWRRMIVADRPFGIRGAGFDWQRMGLLFDITSVIRARDAELGETNHVFGPVVTLDFANYTWDMVPSLEGIASEREIANLFRHPAARYAAGGGPGRPPPRQVTLRDWGMEVASRNPNVPAMVALFRSESFGEQGGEALFHWILTTGERTVVLNI